ncbi:MAG: hypothetical protein PHT03_08080 [Bacilli bacterium]|nr:hypothetical protein [Bacilli bacterium]
MTDGFYQAVLQALGGEPTPVQRDWAYIAACVLLCLGCYGALKLTEWLLKF